MATTRVSEIAPSGENSQSEPFGHRGQEGGKPRPSGVSDDAITGESFSRLHGGADEQLVDGHNSIGFELGYLPPDQRPGHPGELLSHLADPEIEEDTEAAEALRANANVKVRKVGKVARSLNAQSVRRLVKRATLRSKSGNMRGKPPRIPPGRTSVVEDPGNAVLLDVLEEMYGEEEERISEEDSEGDSSEGSMEENDHDPVSSVEGGPDHHAHKLHAEDRAAHHKKKAPLKEDGGHAQMGPATEAEAKKHMRHSTMLEEAKDIPADVVAATMEAGRKFLGAVDPHNMLQIQRWRRKKKGGKKNRKSYVKGKVIDGRHELYTLSIAVMLGVRTSVAKTNAIITSVGGRRTLNPQDFMCEEKYEFAPKGSPNTPPHKLSHTFKFKDYAPMAFAYIRRMFGVNEFDFLLSVCGNANFIEFISNAKSGQFFFYSSDGKYMIKTMTNAESKFLRRILPHYFKHCTQNPNTIITKFLGMYRVKLYHLRRNVKFVIMNSVYCTDKYLQTFYDLKGSDVGRDAKPGQDVLKDNDLRRKLPQDALSIHPEVRERLRAQIVADCVFLRDMKIMDYSMLIGIHHIPLKQNDQSLATTGFRIRHPSVRQTRKGSKGEGSMVSSGVRFEDPDRNGGAHSDAASQSSTRPDSARSSFSNSNEAAPNDSTRKLIMDIRDSNISMSNFELGGLLEEEDDCSYLEGSEPRERFLESHKHARHSYQHHHTILDDIEMKKEETIEQIYWPFHRFWDINGFRRMKAKSCFRCKSSPCTCEGHSKLVKAWGIPEFEPPISNRKDGGLMMDTTGLELPLVFKGPTGDRLYEGKIFFLGIIDILQQYNVRKRVETSYRKVEGMGASDPSCVHPADYAERFIRFFDEYSAQCVPANTGDKKMATITNTDEKTEIECSPVANGDVMVDVSSELHLKDPPMLEIPAPPLKHDAPSPMSTATITGDRVAVRTSTGTTLDVSDKTSKRKNLPIF